MRLVPILGLLALVACSPSHDWRELRPAGSGATLLLPCKPNSMTRDVQLAGGTVQLSLWACSAGGQTWALAFTDLGDPARVGAALDELRGAAVANVAGAAPQALPLQVPGATPNPASTRVQTSGKLPDGQAVQEQVAVFTHGTKVFQATVLGATLPADATEAFFGSLRVGS